MKKTLIFSIVYAAMLPVGINAQSVDAGRAAYTTTCVACHGANGEGNKALGAPAIAGQSAWYVQRQLQNFRAGARGTASADTYGAQMRAMAMAIGSDADVANIGAFLESLGATDPGHEGGGDAAAGEGGYASCAACHGTAGEGNEIMGAPRLSGLPDWYVVRQLQNFKSGTRGSGTGDTFGATMMGMAQMLADDAAMWNVAAYIRGFGN
ncbi:MAG: c-type cytochrome [Gemmatimonadales bacterium]